MAHHRCASCGLAFFFSDVAGPYQGLHTGTRLKGLRVDMDVRVYAAVCSMLVVRYLVSNLFFQDPRVFHL